MEIEELKVMSKGLRIALKYAKGKLRFINIEGMYAESLVAQKLLENRHAVEFHAAPFDLLVDGKHRMEVKCGKFGEYCAGASFRKGTQIIEKQFDYCVFVIINEHSFEPIKFFVFSIEDLKECAILRPKMTDPDTPSILFYYRDFKDFVEESKRTGEPVFEIEKKLHSQPEKFEEKWDKISDTVR